MARRNMRRTEMHVTGLRFAAKFVVGLVLCAQAFGQAVPVVVDASAPGTPLPHFWEKMFGSGRAVLALRESYRDDLREVKKATDVEYVRFHNVLHDEVGIYSEDEQGKPIYNFTYVDQIYDGLLKIGVRP